MATVKNSIPHTVRTAHERRHSGAWTATLSKIEDVNSIIRLLRLGLPKDGVRIMNRLKHALHCHLIRAFIRTSHFPVTTVL